MVLQVQKAGGLLGVTSRGLLILAVLLLIILLMFIIIIVLAALWPRTKAQEAPRVCDTPACLRAAAQVGNSPIKFTFDPDQAVHIRDSVNVYLSSRTKSSSSSHRFFIDTTTTNNREKEEEELGIWQQQSGASIRDWLLEAVQE